MKKFVVALLVLISVFGLISCEEKPAEGPDVAVPEAPVVPSVGETDTKKLSSDTSVAEINSWISDGTVRKIVGDGNSVIKLESNSTINIGSGTVILENLTIEGSVETSGTNEPDPEGIVISNPTGEVNLYLKNVTMKNFGYAILAEQQNNQFTNTEAYKSVAKVNVYIIDSTFENCHKGLYVNNLGTLQVFGSDFTKMGVKSDENGTVITRSGSAFDINQFVSGKDVVFYDSTFTECGGAGTSGAIKIKVRGGSDETATDIPQDNIKGSLDSVMIYSCEFTNSGNDNSDFVIGTASGKEDDNIPKKSTYPESLAAKTTIFDTQLKIKDASGNGYTLNTVTHTLEASK